MRNKWIAHASHAVLSFNCDRTVARGDDFTLHYFPTGRGVPSAPYKLSVMLAGPFALSTMNSTTYPLLWTISGNIVGVGSAPRKAVSRKSPREFVCDRHTSATNPDGNETSRTPVLLPIYWWARLLYRRGKTNMPIAAGVSWQPWRTHSLSILRALVWGELVERWDG